VHAQITCRTKLFSAASAETVAYAKPNTKVALVDAALPGTLPVLNKEAVDQAVRLAYAYLKDSLYVAPPI
jgi:aspartyl-tRNA(Asn)/glutamyl-tRNA(Gln) amidotransferase subunit B